MWTVDPLALGVVGEFPADVVAHDCALAGFGGDEDEDDVGRFGVGVRFLQCVDDHLVVEVEHTKDASQGTNHVENIHVRIGIIVHTHIAIVLRERFRAVAQRLEHWFPATPTNKED